MPALSPARGSRRNSKANFDQAAEALIAHPGYGSHLAPAAYQTQYLANAPPHMMAASQYPADKGRVIGRAAMTSEDVDLEIYPEGAPL